MRSRSVLASCVLFTLVLGLALAGAPGVVSAQATNPRYGQWRLKPADASAPPSTNVMVYEPHNGTGMKISINRLEADGTLTFQWGYATMFDGKEEPMTGSRSQEVASVRMLSDRVAEITYKRDNVINQILTNVISTDNQTLGIIYMRMDAEGKTTRVTYATYERMP
ncbi:MAG: hypothetical protein HQ485_13080 [Acidobacteria bacterium]|jgi:hypothetical protein|nr:hypothetical protein [Acidobacteriota bacterium]